MAEPRAKARLIMWVGQLPRYITRRNNATGVREVTVDYNFERNREIPYDGSVVRSLHPPLRENDRTGIVGLSRTYHWGPKAPFLSEVLPADADIILNHPTIGGRFRDVTDHKGRLGSRTIKGYYRDGMVRELDGALHQPSVDIVQKRLGIRPKLILPPGVTFDLNVDEDGAEGEEED